MINKNDSGQSLFEFLIFLPFLIVMVFILITISGSINGAINQQKAARAYFFYFLKGNSTFPTVDDLAGYADNGVQMAGFFSIGWMDYLDNENPVAPCYEMSGIVSEDKGAKCLDSLYGKTKTNFIRVYTIFGACSTNYDIVPGKYVYHHLGSQISGACTLR